MSEVLRPYTEFDSRDLAMQLHEAVSRNTTQLEERNLHGPIARYGGSLSLAQEKVQKGQREHAEDTLGHYAVIGESGDAIGAASVFPDLKLIKTRVHVPSSVGRHVPLMTISYPHARPNVHAWADDNEDVLSEVYKELVDVAGNKPHFHPITGMPIDSEPLNSTWTVEPLHSPPEIHSAITAHSGLRRVAIGRFDDGGVLHSVPPLGALYTQPHSEWRTSHGYQKELRKGKHSVITKIDRLIARHAGHDMTVQ